QNMFLNGPTSVRPASWTSRTIVLPALADSTRSTIAATISSTTIATAKRTRRAIASITEPTAHAPRAAATLVLAGRAVAGVPSSRATDSRAGGPAGRYGRLSANAIWIHLLRNGAAPAAEHQQQRQERKQEQQRMHSHA